MEINRMVNTVKQYYPVAHISDQTPISFRFCRYRYQILTDEWLWALQAENGEMEIYNNEGLCINIINDREEKPCRKQK